MTGASSHLQSRNMELESQVRDQAREMALLKESLAGSEKRIKSLESEIRSDKGRIGSSKIGAREDRFEGGTR